MPDNRNPFEYGQATHLSREEMLLYYIEDYNYSRFVSSKRNVFLVGERGTGKTMTFLYYSLPVQVEKCKKQHDELDLSMVSIYVPCNTPLYHRKEYELLDELNAALISEHFLVGSMMYALIDAIYSVANIMTPDEENNLRKELEYIFNIELLNNIPFISAFKHVIDKSCISMQRAINENEDIRESFFLFNNGIKSVLGCFSQLAKLSNSHFSFMIDDAQLLNRFQIRSLNSWIAFRDNALFSFKVATTRVDAPPLITSSGGSILEGHDFTKIEMEQPYQNKWSSFGKLAQRIIESRLRSVNIEKTPHEFFPENPVVTEGLKKAKIKAEQQAHEKYPDGTSKQISDYVYKYTRAIYFRERSSKANLPDYSGFEVLTHLSTGVIRNLLDPCFHMYDSMLSESRVVDFIPPKIQTDVIRNLSKKKWDFVQNLLDNTIEGCSRMQGQYVFHLLDNLAILFWKRLQKEISEPRAVEFTISGLDEYRHKELIKIINIAQKAQLIYTYKSSAKDSGKREVYYMPNRMLWPERGLDPYGQHARVSITADNLQNAAITNREIPFLGDANDEPNLFTTT